MTETMEAPTWVCPAGRIVGWRDDGVVRATGIRYARAGRYEKPVAEPPADRVVEATSWAPACPQAPVPLLDAIIRSPLGNLRFDEHCQHLSVTAPPDARAGDSLPVMVWIHGGSYASGAGDAPSYDPAALVREQRVIVVTVTYRLALFGYLGSGSGTPANLGLLDQLEALRWVQRNIAAFGGDPENVTLFGQSAGADAVTHLMIAHGAEGLFRRAIIQSAPFGVARGREPMTRAMLEEAARIPADLSAADLVAAQPRVLERARPFGLMAAMAFGVQYGLDPLPPEREVEEAWQHAAARIEVLVGYTDREVALYVPGLPALAKLSSIPVLGPLARHVAVKALTRKIYRAGVDQFASRHRRGGGRGYRYEFLWGAPGNPFAAAHASELPLLFGNRAAWEDAPIIAGAPWAEVDRQGRLLREIWARFARTGELTATNLPGLVRIRAI